MTIKERLKWALQTVVCPQACVLCESWVANVDFSPLCSYCLADISPLRTPFCDKCGVPCPGNLIDSFVMCSDCRKASPRFTRARSWGLYEGNLGRIIRTFKFEGFWRLAAPLSDFLRQCQSQHFPRIDWIVPVPLHPKRRSQRGFDQTLLLAKALSHKAGIPLLQCVKRTRNTAPQFGLDHAGRRHNVKGAFEVRRGQALEEKRILLLDDVMTTGATVDEICRVLQTHAEPEDVQVLTVARVSKSVL